MFVHIFEPLDRCVVLVACKDPKRNVFYFLKTCDDFSSFSFKVKPRTIIFDQIEQQVQTYCKGYYKVSLCHEFRGEINDAKSREKLGFYFVILDTLICESSVKSGKWLTFSRLVSSLASNKNRAVYIKVLQILTNSHKQTIKVVEKK